MFWDVPKTESNPIGTCFFAHKMCYMGVIIWDLNNRLIILGACYDKRQRTSFYPDRMPSR